MAHDTVLHIVPLTPDDWPAILRIYREGIRTGHATFEQEEGIPGREAWFAAKLPDLLFKAERGEMLGWCALSPVSPRWVYRGVVEVSVYVAAAARGQGIGTRLLRHLIAASEAAGIWTLQATIFPENEASLALHCALGFRLVGRRERLGQLHGSWRDVLLLERRSPHL